MTHHDERRAEQERRIKLPWRTPQLRRLDARAAEINTGLGGDVDAQIS